MEKAFVRLLFRICMYATASTEESVYIIGGYTGSDTITTIGEYRNGKWSIAGSLSQARDCHAAISFGAYTMIVGGYPDSGKT